MPRLLRLAWRNVRRNLRRTSLTVSAIAFATFLIVFHVGLNTGMHDAIIEDAVRLGSGHLAVSGDGYRRDRTLERYIHFDDELTMALEAHPEIRGIAPRVLAFGLLSTDTATQGIALIGVDPEREATVSTLHERVQRGSFFEGDESRGILLGEALARNLSVDVGDSLLLYSIAFTLQTAYEIFTVVGTVKLPGAELDRSLALITLDDAQSFFEYGDRVSEVAILAGGAAESGPLARSLEASLASVSAVPFEILEWQELMPQLLQFILLDDASMVIVLGIVVVVVAFGIFNTILMSVMERRREFGVLHALGLRPNRLVRLVFLETLLLALAGVAVGLLLSLPTVAFLEGAPVSFEDRVVTITESISVDFVLFWKLKPWNPVGSAVVVVAVSLIAGVYPAMRVGRGRPVDALRSH